MVLRVYIVRISIRTLPHRFPITAPCTGCAHSKLRGLAAMASQVIIQARGFRRYHPRGMSINNTMPCSGCLHARSSVTRQSVYNDWAHACQLAG
jgi:hypothetical protein